MEGPSAESNGESHFRLLYEEAPLGYQSLDAEGCFLDVNQAWLDVLGYARDEVIGRSFAEFLTPQHRELFRQRFPRFKEIGRVSGVEFEMIRKDGTRFLASFDGRIGRNEQGEFLRTHCILQDVTERRRAEDALARSHAELCAVYNNAPVMMAVLDGERRVVYANRALVSFLGLANGDLVQAPPGDLLRCAEAVNDPRGCGHSPCCRECSLWTALLASQRTGEPQQDVWFSTILLDDEGGREVVLRLSTAPIRAGGQDRILLCLEDVTAQVVQEVRLAEMESQLQRTARLATLGELAAGLAHELSQPLFAIGNYAQACMNVAAAHSPDVAQIQRWTAAIARAAATSNDVLRRMREFARTGDSQRTPAAVRQLIDDAALLVRYEAQARRLAIEIDVSDPDDLYVEVQPAQFHQVFVNLLRNAIEATDAGEAKSSVVVRAGRHGDQVRIDVIDRGCGLGGVDARRIFDPFFTTKPHGLGLGLAMSKTIVEAHGGSIWVTPDDEVGAVFTVALPAVRTA